MKRVCAGTLGPDGAHKLFDRLLRHATMLPERSLNGFLAALARAPTSDTCRDGPALAVTLFSRVCREEETVVQRVASLTNHSYSVVVECCCRARRPDLVLAFFARFLRTGLGSYVVVADTLRRCLPVSSSTLPPSASWSPIAAF
jgi:pentatricopeptide repeat protein